MCFVQSVLSVTSKRPVHEWNKCLCLSESVCVLLVWVHDAALNTVCVWIFLCVTMRLAAPSVVCWTECYMVSRAERRRMKALAGCSNKEQIIISGYCPPPNSLPPQTPLHSPAQAENVNRPYRWQANEGRSVWPSRDKFNWFKINRTIGKR